MQNDTPSAPISKGALWTGRVMSTLPVLLLLFSGIMKLAGPPDLADGFGHLGIPVNHALGLGILELACTAVYLIPRTSVLGAILLTGYLGGATSIHVRVGDPFYGPVIAGVLLWGGLFLRDRRLRALIPLKQPAA